MTSEEWLALKLLSLHFVRQRGWWRVSPVSRRHSSKHKQDRHVHVYFLTTWNFGGVYILMDAHQYSLACLCGDCILHTWLLYHSVLYQEITAILTLTMGYHKCILQTTVLSVYVNYWVSILHSYVVHVCHFPFNSFMLSRRFACMSHSPVLHTTHPANEPIVWK